MSKPLHCPEPVYLIMFACWSPRRPSFSQLVDHLTVLMDPSLPPAPPLMVHMVVFVWVNVRCAGLCVCVWGGGECLCVGVGGRVGGWVVAYPFLSYGYL
jgi:hypothetical protein